MGVLVQTFRLSTGELLSEAVREDDFLNTPVGLAVDPADPTRVSVIGTSSYSYRFTVSVDGLTSSYSYSDDVAIILGASFTNPMAASPPQGVLAEGASFDN